MKTNKNLFNSILVSITLLLLPLVAGAQDDGFAQVGVTQFSLSMLLIAVVIGVVFNLWKITQSFGGIIGSGMRRVGVGIIFLSIEALDRAVQAFGVIGVVNSWVPTILQPVAHDLLIVKALFFVTIGFTKFYSATKA